MYVLPTYMHLMPNKILLYTPPNVNLEQMYDKGKGKVHPRTGYEGPEGE
jgi:hypothetical protein